MSTAFFFKACCGATEGKSRHGSSEREEESYTDGDGEGVKAASGRRWQLVQCTGCCTVRVGLDDDDDDDDDDKDMRSVDTTLWGTGDGGTRIGQLNRGAVGLRVQTELGTTGCSSFRRPA